MAQFSCRLWLSFRCRLTSEALLYVYTLPQQGAGFAFFLVGFGCSASSLVLAALPAHLEAAVVPVATTFVLTLGYLLSALIQVLAGQPGGADGITTFSSYQASLGMILVPVAVAMASSFLIRSRGRSIAPA